MKSQTMRSAVPFVCIGSTIHRLGEKLQETVCEEPVSGGAIVSSKMCEDFAVANLCRTCVPSIPFSPTLDAVANGWVYQQRSRVLRATETSTEDATSAVKELYLLGCVWRDYTGTWKTTRLGEFLLDESRNNPTYSSYLALEVLSDAMSREVRFSDYRRGAGSLTVDHRVCKD